MAQVVRSSSGKEAVGPLLLGSKVGCLPGSPGLVGRVQLLPKLSCAGEGDGGQKGGGGQVGQGLAGDGQMSLLNSDTLNGCSVRKTSLKTFHVEN